MSTTTITDPVNDYQLALELPGVSLRVIGPRPDGTTTVHADIDQQDLDDAVAAHVADPEIQPADTPPPPDPMALLVEAVGLDGALAAAILGATLAGRADDLWTALAGIAEGDTARPAVEIVTDAAITAATQGETP